MLSPFFIIKNHQGSGLRCFRIALVFLVGGVSSAQATCSFYKKIIPDREAAWGEIKNALPGEVKSKDKKGFVELSLFNFSDNRKVNTVQAAWDGKKYTFSFGEKLEPHHYAWKPSESGSGGSLRVFSTKSNHWHEFEIELKHKTDQAITFLKEDKIAPVQIKAPEIKNSPKLSKEEFAKSEVFYSHPDRVGYEPVKWFQEMDPHSLQSSEPRSSWGKRMETLSFQKNYADIHFSHRRSNIVFEESFAAKDPQLLNIADDISRFQKDPREFAFQSKKLGRDLSYEDYQRFYRSRHELLTRGLDEIQKKLKKLEPNNTVIDDIFEHKFKRRLTSLNRILDSQSLSHSGYLERFNDYNGRYNGLCGELEAMLSLPRVKNVSVSLGNIPNLGKGYSVEAVIHDAFVDLRHEIEVDPAVLGRIQKKYPNLFRDRDWGNNSLRDYLENMQYFIHGKEADVVRFGKDGKICLVENKNPGVAMTAEDLLKVKRNEFKAIRNGKTETLFVREMSKLQQVLETKEALEFLGIAKDFVVEYRAPMTPSAVKLLENHGIRVVPVP